MMTTPERPDPRRREWFAAGAIGGIGTPILLWSLVNVWGPMLAATPAATPGLTWLPIVILLSMPVGLLAGTVARGIGGLIVFWLGALVSTFAIATQFYEPGLGGLAAALAVLVIPQAVLPGYVLARLVDRTISGRSRPAPARIVGLWLVPSIAAYALVGLIGAMNVASLRESREASCAPFTSDMALSGRIVFVGSHALCVADLERRSVRMAYGSPTDVDETLISPRWSPDGTTIAAVSERRPVRGSITREIVLITVEGGAVATIDRPGQVGTVNSLDWAPDGRRLVVAADDPGCGVCARLYITSIDGGPWEVIPSAPGVLDVRYPAWSAVNDQILVNAASDAGQLYGAAGLLIIDPDGQVLASVATDADQLSAASWSVDGSRIAFGRRGERGGVDVYLARGNGTTTTRLTTTTDRAVNQVSTARPVWSPDGEALAVSVYASNELPHAISIVGSGGGEATLLIENASDAEASDFDWGP